MECSRRPDAAGEYGNARRTRTSRYGRKKKCGDGVMHGARRQGKGGNEVMYTAIQGQSGMVEFKFITLLHNLELPRAQIPTWRGMDVPPENGSNP